MMEKRDNNNSPNGLEDGNLHNNPPITFDDPRIDDMSDAEYARYSWSPRPGLLSIIDVINLPNHLEEMYQAIVGLYELGADSYFLALSRNRKVLDEEFDFKTTLTMITDLGARIDNGEIVYEDDPDFRPRIITVVEDGIANKTRDNNIQFYKDLAYRLSILYKIISELVAEYYYRQLHEKQMEQAFARIRENFDFTSEQLARIDTFIKQLMAANNTYGVFSSASKVRDIFGPLRLAEESNYLDSIDVSELYVESETEIPPEIDEAMIRFFKIGKTEEWDEAIPRRIGVPILDDLENGNNSVYIGQLTDYLVARFMGLSFDEAVMESIHIPDKHDNVSTEDSFISRLSLAQHKGLKIHFVGRYERSLFKILDLFNQLLNGNPYSLESLQVWF